MPTECEEDFEGSSATPLKELKTDRLAIGMAGLMESENGLISS